MLHRRQQCTALAISFFLVASILRGTLSSRIKLHTHAERSGGDLNLVLSDISCSDLDISVFYTQSLHVRFRIGGRKDLEVKTKDVRLSKGNRVTFEDRLELPVSETDLAQGVAITIKQKHKVLEIAGGSLPHLGVDNAILPVRSEDSQCKRMVYKNTLGGVSKGSLTFKYTIDAPICRFSSGMLFKHLLGLWHYLGDDADGLFEITREQGAAHFHLSMDGAADVQLYPQGDWLVTKRLDVNGNDVSPLWRVKPSEGTETIVFDSFLPEEGNNDWENDRQHFGKRETCLMFWKYDFCQLKFLTQLGPDELPMDAQPLRQAPMPDSLLYNPEMYLSFLSQLVEHHRHESAAELLGNMENFGHSEDAVGVVRSTALFLLDAWINLKSKRRGLEYIKAQKELPRISSALMHLVAAGSDTEVIAPWAGKESNQMMKDSAITIREKIQEVVQHSINRNLPDFDESWMEGVYGAWWVRACEVFRSSWELQCSM